MNTAHQLLRQWLNQGCQCYGVEHQNDCLYTKTLTYLHENE